MSKKRVTELLQLLAANKATYSDKEELFAYYRNEENAAEIKQLIEEYWDKKSFEILLTKEQSEILYNSIHKTIQEPKPIFKRKNWRPVIIKRWLAAASIVLAAGLFFYMYRLSNNNPSPTDIAALTDIAPPQSSRAVLFLENGERQKLRVTKNVVTLPNTSVNNKSGTHHTIFNPRGSRPIEFVLPDGSRLWLSAESSVKYPVVFDEKERRIQINGEAYLEVTHDAERPFIVYSGLTEVKVLGTRFNINSFDNEIKVALLEGLISVKSYNDSALIKPGQAAVVKTGLNIRKSDTTAAVAWKNAVFDFRQTAIRDIMQEVARWYDVDIRYEGAIPNITLSGTIDRNTNASNVVEMLALSSGLDFKIEGRMIIVKN